MMYQLWVFSGSDLVAYLHQAYEIKRGGKLNTVPTLSFQIPADDPKIQYLTSAYSIRIWNTETEEYGWIYDIVETEDVWGSSGSVVRVECAGALGRLAKEDNISYDTTSTPDTPENIITALLALQEGSDPIGVGTIEPTTPFAFSIENSNILRAVLECTSYLGGYIVVGGDGNLNWWNEPTGSPTREIRYKKNLKGLNRKIEYGAIINRIYTYGFGESEAQITLIDAGEPEEYIEDAASIAAYGLSIRRFTDKRIRHPETLLRWAQRLLDAYKEPVYSYNVDVVNLAAHPDYRYDLESLNLGDVVRVVNPDLDLNVDVVVVGLDEDLSEPHIISVELETPTPDLSDTISNIRDSTHLLQNQDVQIGAGQVTVQGVFTVDGWRSAGQTTIDGGKITAGSIVIGKLADEITITLVYSGSSPPTPPLPDGKLWLDTSDPEHPVLKRWDGSEEEWLIVSEDISSLREAVGDLGDLMDDIFDDEMVTLDEAKVLKVQFEQVLSESVKIRSVGTSLGLTDAVESYVYALGYLSYHLSDYINKPAETYPIYIQSTVRDMIVDDFKAVQATKTYLIDAIESAKDTKAISDFDDTLGDLAYEDAVEKAKLGITIIEGGYLKTGFVDASRIDTGTLNAARLNITGDATFASGYNPIEKTNTFSQDTPPTSIAVGDLWIDTDDDNKMYRANAVGVNTIVTTGNGWYLQRDAGIASALAAAATAQETADGEIIGFYQATEPAAGVSSFGDIWIDTSSPPPDADDIYRYEDASGGSSGVLAWRAAPDNAIGLVYLDAYGAKTTADGKITTFYQDNIPTSLAIGDLWVKTNADNKLYRAASIGATTIAVGHWELARDQGNVDKLGGKYDSAASGARVRIFPDANTGIVVTDDTAPTPKEVFKCIVGGTDVGDVIIGDYNDGAGCKWDKSVPSFSVRGRLEATSIVSGSTLSVAGSIAVPSASANERIIMSGSYFTIYHANIKVAELGNSGATNGNVIFIDDTSLSSAPTSSAIYVKTRANANVLQAIGTHTTTTSPAIYAETAGIGNTGTFKQLNSAATGTSVYIETPSNQTNGLYVNMIHSASAAGYPGIYVNVGHVETYAFYTNAKSIGSSFANFQINFGGIILERIGSDLYWGGAKIN